MGDLENRLKEIEEKKAKVFKEQKVLSNVTQANKSKHDDALTSEEKALRLYEMQKGIAKSAIDSSKSLSDLAKSNATAIQETANDFNNTFAAVKKAFQSLINDTSRSFDAVIKKIHDAEVTRYNRLTEEFVEERKKDIEQTKEYTNRILFNLEQTVREHENKYSILKTFRTFKGKLSLFYLMALIFFMSSSFMFFAYLNIERRFFAPLFTGNFGVFDFLYAFGGGIFLFVVLAMYTSPIFLCIYSMYQEEDYACTRGHITMGTFVYTLLAMAFIVPISQYITANWF